MLEARGIEFSYGSPVLKGVTFSIGEGEVLAAIGPNGSGKSTLLKIIAGILPPAAGDVMLDHRSLKRLSRREAARLIGYVAQESTVQFPLTSLEFVLQGRFAHGRIVGFESDADLREAASAMEMTETTLLAGRLVNELSGGERQRVMIARALATRPRLLVLDEPVANLDIAHQVKMLDLVSRLVRQRAMSAIVVTHELNLAAEFATRVLMLKSGNLICCGAPRDVMTEAALRSVFDTDVIVDESPASGAPRVTLKVAR